MKEIKLNHGYVALVDDEDFEKLNQYRWRAVKDYNTIYARRSRRKGEVGPVTVLMHRIIVDAPDGFVCDHINHNGLDNRKENLRIVTTRQNAQNLAINKTSIYPGVHRKNGKWTARIRIGAKRVNLGSFEEEKAAFDAYCAKLSEIGEVFYDYK